MTLSDALTVYRICARAEGKSPRTIQWITSSVGYFADYFGLVGIRHIIASPYHPQINGKMERYHRTVKGELSLIHCQIPNELERAISSFIQYYNYGRYHEGWAT